MGKHRQSCVAAMGPTLAASCAAWMVPPETTIATIEYLPNMGLGDLSEELHSIDILLRRLRLLGAFVIGIEIVPFRPLRSRLPPRHECPSCTQPAHAEAAHALLAAKFAQYNASVVTLRGVETNNSKLFLADGRHLNANGHSLVARMVMEKWHTRGHRLSPNAGRHSVGFDSETGVCYLAVPTLL